MRRGFTITEVMVAIVFLSVAVLGLVGAQIYAVRSTEGNRQRHMASEIAASTMSIVESRVRRDPTSLAAQARTPVASSPGFDCEIVENFEDDLKQTRRVEIRVFYEDDRLEHKYVLWTLFFHEK